MCLDVVSKTYSRKNALNKKKHGTGWKVIELPYDEEWYFRTVHFHRNTILLFDEWIKDNSKGRIKVYWGPKRSYPTGFHIFKTKRAALHYSLHFQYVVKVHYKEVVAEGWQDKCKSLVVRQYKALRKTLVCV